jgi:hypothetical protein
MSLSEPVADVGGLDASLLRAQLRAELEQRQDSMVHVFAALSGELDAMDANRGNGRSNATIRRKGSGRRQWWEC